MIIVEEILTELREMGDQATVEQKAKKFGIVAHNSLGIYHRDLKKLAKLLPKDRDLAVALFDTEVYEARLLCSKIFPVKELTTDLMDKWVVTFDNWEICDSFCMGIFAKSTLAVPKIRRWISHEPEFERRASFATMAAYCMADKQADNEVFLSFLPLIKQAATDDRLYVKKAVNWALRSIGKRNVDLQRVAIECAEELLAVDHKAARWIAKDALKELERPSVRISDYPRHIYR